MSYSPFFLSGFQHASSSSTSPDKLKFSQTPSDPLSPTKSRVRRLRSTPTFNSSATSMPPSVSLPELPSTPTPSSFLIPPSNPSYLTSGSSNLNIRRSIPLTTVLRTNSTVSTSTVSTRYRRNKRSDALERLEGRSSQWYFKARDSRIRPRPPRKPSVNNFMSMSDDSDCDQNDDVGFHVRVSTTRSSFWFSSRRTSKLFNSLSTPLHSFIDLAEKEDPRARRKSFIEIEPFP